MHVLDTLIICLRKKFLIVGIPLFSSLAAFGIVSLIPQTFYTEMRLRIDDPISPKMPSSGLPNIGGNFSAFFGNMRQSESEEIFLELLIGRDNLVLATEKFKLDSVYKTKNMEGTLKALRKSLNVSIRRTSNVIVCGFKEKDRDMAAALVGSLVNNANDRFIALQKERLAMTMEFMAARQQQLMDSLEFHSKELIEFYRENHVINMERQIALTLATLANYEEQINANRVGEQVARNVTGFNTPLIQEFRIRNQILQQEFQKIRGKYDDDYKPSKESVLINTDWGLDKMLFERIANAKINIIQDILTVISRELALSESQLSQNIPAIQIIQDVYYPDWKIAPKRATWMIISFLIALVLTISFVLLSAYIRGEIEGSSDVNRQKVQNLLKALRK